MKTIERFVGGQYAYHEHSQFLYQEISHFIFWDLDLKNLMAEFLDKGYELLNKENNTIVEIAEGKAYIDTATTIKMLLLDKENE